MLLKAGSTCWRVERADRATLLIDVENYLAAAKAMMLRASRSIHLLNWAFDPETRLDPESGGGGPPGDRIGPFLKTLARERPGLDIRILCWKSALPVSATQGFFPHRAKACFEGSPVRFLLDASVPMGACHHQKMLVVDDHVAFCGGADIAPNRWDTTRHRDDDTCREISPSSRKAFTSRHEVMVAVEGPAARALGDLFRERWRRATGESLSAPIAGEASDAWPEDLAPLFRATTAGISRTAPGWRGGKTVRENEGLHLAAIAGARRCIYLENQYLTSPVVAEALAQRLSEPAGPEVVLISTVRSPSWFDQMTMDRTRTLFLRRLQAADHHGRLYAYVPFTTEGRIIIVHAKLSIIDDRLLRVGSANLNNRSLGFDTECDLSLEAGDDDRDAQIAIAGQRTRLLGHWLGCPDADVESAVAAAGGVGAGIERLRAAGRDRLRPLQPAPIGPLAGFIASYHLGDPTGPEDSWRPWKRRHALHARLRDLRASVA